MWLLVCILVLLWWLSSINRSSVNVSDNGIEMMIRLVETAKVTMKINCRKSNYIGFIKTISNTI